MKRPATSLPKPFSRPSIDLGKAKREWREVLTSEIKAGDTVPDVGVVSLVEKQGNTITLHGPQVVLVGPSNSKRLAFVEATPIG